jgi:predicted nuclease of predicted toxin-antitoxin system
VIRRLLADADLRGAFAAGVVRRNSSIDFKRAADVPLEGLEDLDVLAVAAQENRVLVSHDVSTMPNHLRAMVAGTNSPGVILIPQRLPVAEAIDLLLLVCEAAEPEDFENGICLLPSLVMYGF